MNGLNEAWALQVALDAGKIKANAVYLAKDLLNKFLGAWKGGTWEEIKGYTMTPKQIALMVKLVEEGGPTACGAITVGAAVGDVSGITALFEKASAKLKYPKLEMQTAGGVMVALNLANPKLKNPGCIYVKVNGAYAGKINPDGVYKPNHVPKNLQDLLDSLHALAANPAKVAAEQGTLLGRCCFCMKNLKHPDSIAMGYGPICADAYGLPWGPSATKEAAAAAIAEAVEVATLIIPAEDVSPGFYSKIGGS